MEQSDDSIKDRFYCRGGIWAWEKSSRPIEVQSHYFLFVGNNKNSADMAEPKLSTGCQANVSLMPHPIALLEIILLKSIWFDRSF